MMLMPLSSSCQLLFKRPRLHTPPRRLGAAPHTYIHTHTFFFATSRFFHIHTTFSNTHHMHACATIGIVFRPQGTVPSYASPPNALTDLRFWPRFPAAPRPESHQHRAPTPKGPASTAWSPRRLSRRMSFFFDTTRRPRAHRATPLRKETPRKGPSSNTSAQGNPTKGS